MNKKSIWIYSILEKVTNKFNNTFGPRLRVTLLAFLENICYINQNEKLC